MDPAEFIECAVKLKSSQPNEADLRSAISRAYYGVYHLCLARAKQLPTWSDRSTLHKGGSHEYLINVLKAHKNETLKGLTNQIKSLRSARNKADYELIQKVNFDEADKAVKKANQVKLTLEREASTTRTSS